MKNKKTRNLICSLLLAAVLVGVLLYIDNSPLKSSMLSTVLQKGAIYALLVVSMNLLNGFTGLFSLGQAGFMLLGAYTYAILTIPVDQRINVYQYFDGGIVQFQMPQIPALILAGAVAALFAALIGAPVLRLKSDYLAIATLGFAEILRAVIQWEKLGPLTNASNILRKFTGYDSILFPFIVSGVCIAIIVLLINSTYGRAFKAIREDEIAAEAMGINLMKHKMLSFCTSSFWGAAYSSPTVSSAPPVTGRLVGAFSGAGAGEELYPHQEKNSAEDDNRDGRKDSPWRRENGNSQAHGDDERQRADGAGNSAGNENLGEDEQEPAHEQGGVPSH